MIDWPEELVSDLARRRCVVVMGSGVFANACDSGGKHPPTWAGLVNEILKPVPDTSLIRQLRRTFDYLTLCEVAEHVRGRTEIGRVLKRLFVMPGFKPAEIHEKIFDLDARIVITPSFDKIYETFACHKADGTIVVKNYYDDDILEYIRGSTRVILKMHGTVDTVGKCILTRVDYAKARNLYRSFYEVLFGLFITNSILFIGCGFSDPDVRLLLEDSRFRFASGSPHYFVVPKTECQGPYKDVLEKSLNIKVISFSKHNGYAALTNGLSALRRMVEDRRSELKVSGNW
jgi:hypothetical protein